MDGASPASSQSFRVFRDLGLEGRDGMDWEKVKQKGHRLKYFLQKMSNVLELVFQLWPWGLELQQKALILRAICFM